MHWQYPNRGSAELLLNPHKRVSRVLQDAKFRGSNALYRFGYDSKQSALLNIPTGATGALAALASSWMAGRYNSRGLCVIALLIPGIIGGSLMAFLPASSQFNGGKLAGVYLTAIFGPSKRDRSF
jgi:hypothetical protein